MKPLHATAALVTAALFLSACSHSLADENHRPLTVVVARGYDVITEIGNPSSKFDDKMRAAFSRDRKVEFMPKGDISRQKNSFTLRAMLDSYQYADIYYLSVHGAPPLNEMQTLNVAPSDDNTNFSPKGNSLVTAGNIRESLLGRRGPALVVINGCELNKFDDGIAFENRISSAFGILRGTPGRAFVGWPWEVFGQSQDPAFANMFTAWTRKGSDGTYPTILEVVNANMWGNNTKPPVVLGDPMLRYSDLTPGPQPKGGAAKVTIFRENAVNQSTKGETHWTWNTRLAESGGVGVRFTDVFLSGWRGAKPQQLENARTQVDFRIEPYQDHTRPERGHIRYTRNRDKEDNGRLRAVFCGIDDNGHHVRVELSTVVVAGSNPGGRLEY